MGAFTKFVAFEPFAEYRARARDNLSSHQLGDFRKCPALYHKKKLGLIPDEDRPAYLVGRAAHTLILEGRERFSSEYAVGGPVNPKTGSPFGASTKAYAEWASAQGKPVLTALQATLVGELYASVSSHAEAADLLAEGVAEGVARATYCGESCQVRIDWLCDERGIVDLKTCDDLDHFAADARRYGYVHQTSFYREVLARVSGFVAAVHIIAVEKREPYRCGVWRVSEDALDVAQKDNEEAIAQLQRCLATASLTGNWPTGYEEVRILG